jgi:ABC-type amino acid transport substrate-binding protein
LSGLVRPSANHRPETAPGAGRPETRSLADALEGLKERRGPDLIQCLAPAPERTNHLSFSKPYLSIPRVIYVRADSHFIRGIDDLRGKTLAVPRGSYVAEQLAQRYPDVNLKLLAADGECLEAVSLGTADAYIGNAPLAAYLVLDRGLSNLKVAAPAPFGNDDFSYAGRKDWPELTSIIDKALDAVTPNEKTSIRATYLPVRRPVRVVGGRRRATTRLHHDLRGCLR